MAKFVKSTWFKCITVLLVISVISGGLLAALNDLLFVSSEERTARAVAKIYGEEITVTEDDIILDTASADPEKSSPIEYDFGRIDKIYRVNEDYLFQTVGFQGYKNGTITLWIRVVPNSGAANIDKVILETYSKQTLMSKFGETYFSEFKLTDITENYKNGNFFSPDGGVNSNPNTGATLSATACCNAVNCVIKYIGENLDEN